MNRREAVDEGKVTLSDIMWSVSIGFLSGCVLGVLVNCGHVTPVPVVTPVYDETVTCSEACSRLGEIGCAEAGTARPGGATCVEWCEAYHELWYLEPWKGCVVAAEDRGDVVGCGLECKVGNGA